MKFLCDNCKAKYQIADEKLQGRAVQMKCRKCGHIIEVPSPGLTPSPPKVAPVPAPAPAPVPAPAPARAPAPRAAAPAPRAARPAAASQPTTTPSPARAQPQAGLAGAFAKTVKEKEVSVAIEVLSAGAAEEWYVGINGVPLGPVRLTVLRQKAAQGVVNEDSLVWREGFDEWLPLRQFPELVVLVQEARESAVRGLSPAGQRISSLPQPPRPPPRSSQAVTARAPAPAPSPRPAPSPGESGFGAAVSFGSSAPDVLGASPGPTAVEPGGVLSGLDAGFGASTGRVDAEVMADPFAVPISVEPSVPPPRASVPPARVSVVPESVMRPSIVDDVALGVRKQVRLHPAAGAFIGLLGVLGGVLITAWLTGGKTAPAVTPTVQIVTVTAPAPTQPVPGVPTTTASAVAVNENPAPGDPVRTAPGGTGGKPTETKKDDPKATPTSPIAVGMGDMPGLPGPGVAGPTPGGANASLPQLDQSDIQRVVSSNRGFVRRQCWDPALASKSATAPSTAKVNVTVTIGPDGSVQSANASGGAGYPDLASCVASRVKGWKFPPSSSQSTAQIPFVFAAQ